MISTEFKYIWEQHKIKPILSVILQGKLHLSFNVMLKQYMPLVVRFLRCQDVSNCYVFRADLWESFWRLKNRQSVKNYHLACLLRERRLNTIFELNSLWNNCPSSQNKELLDCLAMLAPGQWQWIMQYDCVLALRAHRKRRTRVLGKRRLLERVSCGTSARRDLQLPLEKQRW